MLEKLQGDHRFVTMTFWVSDYANGFVKIAYDHLLVLLLLSEAIGFTDSLEQDGKNSHLF